MLSIHPPLPQLRAHDPCGHWHKGSQSSSIDERKFADNCWEVTGAATHDQIMYVLCGRHRPNEFYMLSYNIAQNFWYQLAYTEDVGYADWDGGTAIDGNVYAFHCFAVDVHGKQFQHTTDNPRMLTTVVNLFDTYRKEWPTALRINGRNKVAVTASGLVVVLILTSSDLEVHGSTSSGNTYSLIFSLPGVEVNEANVVINPVDGLVYLAVVSAANNRLRIYRGSGTGTGWVLRSTTPILNAQSLQFRTEGGRFYATVNGRFYFSTDDCATFTSRDLMVAGNLFAAMDTQLYNLTDSLDYYTNDYESSIIEWIPVITPVPTSTSRATLHNRGPITAYIASELRHHIAGGLSVAFLLSFNLGKEWKIIDTPFAYYAGYQQVIERNDSPIWPFYPQPLKI